MTTVTAFLGGSLAPFTPVVHTFGGASGTETIPSAGVGTQGPSQVIIEIWGGGAEGGRDASGALSPGGASSGSYSKSIIALTPTNYGQTMAYVAGASVPGHSSGSFTGATGNASSVTSGTFSLTSMNAPAGIGGQPNAAGAAPSNATGGNTTNTQGNTTGSISGAGAPNGGGNVSANTSGSTPGGGGGGSSNVGSSGGGAAGRVKFSYS